MLPRKQRRFSFVKHLHFIEGKSDKKNGILGYAYIVGSTSRQSSFSCHDEFQMLKKKVKKVDATVF